jgi:hypothetical protein
MTITLRAALSVVVAVHRVATAHGGRIIGGIANAKVDRAARDLLILDNGLLFAECPKRTVGGRNRLRELAGSAMVSELAQRHQFLPYEEIAAASVVGRVPVRVDLTLRDGRAVRVREGWKSELLAKDSHEVLRRVLTGLAGRPS